MYGLIKDNELIAIHDDKEVIKEYQEYLLIEHCISTVRCKINKKIYKKINGGEDKYLIKYNDKYITNEDRKTIYKINNESTYDINLAKEVIIKILECEKDEKNIKAMRRTIRILDKTLNDIKSDVPSPELINNIKTFNDEFRDIISNN